MSATAAKDIFLGHEENKEEQENEVTALESIFEGEVKVISRPGHSPTSLFCLQLDVMPRLPDTGLRVDVVKATSSDIMEEAQGACGGGQPPGFQRSESGYHIRSSIDVQHVPPLTLQVIFPAEYPSDGLPWLCLSCAWLQQRHLATLYRSLCDVMESFRGSPLVYPLVDWLQENVFEGLGITEVLVLTAHDPDNEVSVPDNEVTGPDGDEDGEEGVGESCDGDLEATLLLFLRHDYVKNQQKFRSSHQECGVCMDEVKGRDCAVISGCQHVWCRPCLQQHCLTLLQDGAANNMRCPEPECEETVSVPLLKELLTSQQFERWERLALQQALDVMGDIEYCPRCNTACVRDEDERLNLATCPACCFAFCTACRDTWHQGRMCLPLEAKLEEVRLRMQNARKEAREEAARKLKHLQQELASEKEIKCTTKKCPTCSAAIEKISGCNKMRCVYCGNNMCWKCGNSIMGYDHFQGSGCILFDGQPGQAAFVVPPRRHPNMAQYQVQVQLQADPAQRRNLVRCPRCNLQALRGDNNNHMRCIQCRTNYCFLCRKAIIGTITAHFVPPSPCRQHGNL